MSVTVLLHGSDQNPREYPTADGAFVKDGLLHITDSTRPSAFVLLGGFAVGLVAEWSIVPTQAQIAAARESDRKTRDLLDSISPVKSIRRVKSTA